MLGALLSPTDPVLSSSVVTDPRVPRVIRHSLNLESGLNDGLALPAVLAFAAALDPHESHFVWWHFVIQDIGLGLAFGLVCGFVGSVLLPRGERGAGAADSAHQKALYGLGLAFTSYGLAVLPPHGNGFIAVFVAAIVIGVRRPDLRLQFAEHSQVLVEVIKLAIFTLFGSLLTLAGSSATAGPRRRRRGDVSTRTPDRDLGGARGHTHADVLARRSWRGSARRGSRRWPSPAVLSRRSTPARRIFNIAALAVFASIILHGPSDTPGAEWIARRSRDAADEPAEAPALA